MRFKIIAPILGLFLILFSASMVPPLAVSLWYDDGEAYAFLQSLIIAVCLGGILWWPTRNQRGDLRRRDGFLVVALFWVGLGLFGSLPLLLGPHLSYVDAVFEAVSGFTTTGATVIIGLENLPPSILYYRQQIQWLGGMGVIVLAVAILPMLGIGGMQLYRAETPGPLKDDKLTPRITHTARALWVIYLGLTVACALAFWFAGMTPFDAISHAFATISTGGFSTHDDSLGYFHSPLIEGIAVVFMLLGGINFSIHFLAWHRRSIRQYLHDSEVRTFLIIVVAVTGIASSILYVTHTYLGMAESFRYAAFEVVSVITSTGFGTTDFTIWPLMLPAMLMFVSFSGGCAGSTAGGMKVMRLMLLGKQALREMRRLVHPRSIQPIKVGGRVLNEGMVHAVWGFFALYVATFVVLTLLMSALGLDQVTAFGAVATSMNNLGPGLGQVATSFHEVGSGVKMVAIAGMLLGRLEIFTILVVLSPAFWRD